MGLSLTDLRKWAWLIVVILTLIAAALIVRNIRISGEYAAAKEAFLKDLKQREAKISELTQEKAAWAERAAAYMAAADSQAERVADLERALARQTAEAEALKRKIATMPADEIVAETRTRLGVVESEVFKTGLGIQFSLAAARKNLSRLYDADFSLVQEKQYKEIINTYHEQVVSLRDTIDAQTKEIQAAEGIISQYQDLKLSYADILKKSERQSKWLKVTIGGAAVAVTGAGLYLIFKGK